MPLGKASYRTRKPFVFFKAVPTNLGKLLFCLQVHSSTSIDRQEGTWNRSRLIFDYTSLLCYDHLCVLECSWEGRRSYFFLLRNLIARQATCQEVVFFRRGNAYDFLTFKDYIKGDILPHPLPRDPIMPLREGWKKRLQGKGGSWRPRKLGVDFSRHRQHVRPNPKDEFPARTSTPSHKHKHWRGVPAESPGGSAIPAFSPNTYIHNSPDSNWE